MASAARFRLVWRERGRRLCGSGRRFRAFDTWDALTRKVNCLPRGRRGQWMVLRVAVLRSRPMPTMGMGQAATV